MDSNNLHGIENMFIIPVLMDAEETIPLAENEASIFN